jgi:radical SAM superfamily enzyme YgiQ (UPF0313 family)
MTYVHEHGYAFDLLDVDINEYDDDHVEEYIKNNKYDVILYGAIVTHYKWIKWLTKTIKKYNPDTYIVVGNSVSSSCYEVFMANAPADIAVVGEGEITCLAVLDAIKNKSLFDSIEGIVYRSSDGQIIANKARPACDVNSLPMIDWDFFEVDRYLSYSEGTSFGSVSNEKLVTMPVTTARGCVFNCTFCHYVFWNDPYRIRKPDEVVKEIRRNIEKYGANYINFWDDLSFSSLKHVERLIDEILTSGLKFEWSAAIRTDLFGRITKKSYEERLALARKMREAGCRSLGFSLESGSSEILKMMDKHVNPEYFREQVEILQEAGIICNTSVVFGYPIETEKTIKQTFDMCLEASIYPSIGFLLPLPSTQMYDYAVKNGFINDEDEYLSTITERQDICLNMTDMGDAEVMSYIEHYAQDLSRRLKLNLATDSLVKTGGYKRHTNVDAQVNDVTDSSDNEISFNYSEALFK